MGFIVISLLWPIGPALRHQWLLNSCFAVGLGFGVASIIFFIWLVKPYPHISFAWFIGIEIFVILVLTILFLKRIINNNKLREEHRSIENNFVASINSIHQILSFLLYTALVSSFISFIFITLNNPHGEWDAFAIWNVRARFLFRGAQHWMDAFSINLAQTNYPLLIPGIIARSWQYIGKDTVIVPGLISMFFTFATVGLLYASLSHFRSKGQAILASLILLGTPRFIMHGAYQYADIPVGFFFLSTIILLLLNEEHHQKGYGQIVLAGMMAGFAGWTKNEGLLFMIVVVSSGIIITISHKGWRSYLNDLCYFVLGMLPILVAIIYFKMKIASPNDIMGTLGLSSTLERLSDIRRYFLIISTFPSSLLKLGGLCYGISLLLLIYCYLAGISVDKKYKYGIQRSIAILILLIIGYFTIFLITPNDLPFQLRAMYRLIIQMWPFILFIYFMIVRTPEQIFAKAPSPGGA